MNYKLDDSVTLGEARAWLRARAAKGERCPCCRQRAQVYRRHLNSGNCSALIAFYCYERRAGVGNWFHWRAASGNIKKFCTEYAMLKHWGVIEQMPNPNDPTKKRAGYWRVTDRGRGFVQREFTLPKSCVIYDDRLLRFEPDQVTIVDALGKRFDYSELMAQRPESDQPQ